MTKRPSATSGRPKRQRDATATRAAILASARQAFAEVGYDGAGVRQIAQGAGVTAMLVNRYFGSKERLFAEVIAAIMAEPVLLTADRLSAAQGDLGFADALVALTAADGPRLDGFRIMCRSASSATAAAVGREQIEAHYHRALTMALPGVHAAERAAVILAVVAGLQIMRQMIGLKALAQCPPATLAEILTPVFRHLWSGSPASPEPLNQRSRRGGRNSRAHSRSSC